MAGLRYCYKLKGIMVISPSFKSYAASGNAAVESFTSYRNQSNVRDDSFQSYAKNSNLATVNFGNYGQSANVGTDKFTGHSKGECRIKQLGSNLRSEQHFHRLCQQEECFLCKLCHLELCSIDLNGFHRDG